MPQWIAIRVGPAFAALAVLIIGLGVRALTTGGFAKYAGVASYATFVYTLVVLAAPRTRPVLAAPLALAICWLVEFAQITPVPAELSARSVLFRLALGSTFNGPDLFWYAVGAALAAAAHWVVQGR
jgi:Protein of unknown function (DUF2809)